MTDSEALAWCQKNDCTIARASVRPEEGATPEPGYAVVHKGTGFSGTGVTLGDAVAAVVAQLRALVDAADAALPQGGTS